MTNKYMYFVANWKMFGGVKSLNSLDKVIKFLRSFKKKNFIKIVYCPPNTLIDLMVKKLKKTKIYVGAQNCHESEKFGAFTGSVNPMMLKNVGARYVIIGHSEIREKGETNKIINLKIHNALKSGLKVIFCIGETSSEKKNKMTKNVLNKQIKFGLDRIRNNKSIIIAYEPVWAIGSGIIPKTNELLETVEFIKKKTKNIKVLYGGSVNPKNIHRLNLIDNLDGYLIGGASQESKKFIDIIKKTYN